MQPSDLRYRIKRLDADTPRHKALEHALQEGVGYGSAWYGSQKEHWLGWLAEYDGPGAYGRRGDPNRDARYVYNHIQCAPMLFWLAEASGIEDKLLSKAFNVVINAPATNASQCAALRRVLPWEAVAMRLPSPSWFISMRATLFKALKR
ncbi:hypothetical protein [Planktotalea sp.]|uniref:hypothetical protein n=1 Tax=Planktotalea sp. TaxID=2029877 RepID=UPI003D6C26D4